MHIVLSDATISVTVNHRQLIAYTKVGGSVQINQAPCEDIQTVLVDNPKLEICAVLLSTLASAGAVVTFADRKHQPVGIMCPIQGNTLSTERLHQQIALGRAETDMLWRELVEAKISNQVANINNPTAVETLQRYAREVEPGDPTNREGHAAKLYWKHIFSSPFTRTPRTRTGRNGQLDYAYSIVRTRIIHKIVAAGLHPALGVNHSNRGNAFCLADDLIEPFRPIVDRWVDEYCDQHESELS